MKNLIAIVSLLFFFFQNGISQDEPRLQKIILTRNFQDKLYFKKYREETYTYNNSGNISLKVLTQYDSDEEIELISGVFFDYNSENLLQRKSNKRYNPDVDLWITKNWTDYEYDSNGCLILEEIIFNIGGFDSRKTYTRNSNCQILSVHKESNSFPDSLVSNYYFEREYLTDGISYTERNFNNSSFADSTLTSTLKTQTYNEKELLINSHVEYIITLPFFIPEKKYTYQYDGFNNIIKERRFQKHQDSVDWELLEDQNYYNDYDEKGFLVKTKIEEVGYGIGQVILSPHLNRIFDYKNSCEGIVEERLSKLQGSEDFITKNEYIYEGINECIDLEKIQLEVLVFPNPSAGGNIQITSSIFKTGNTDISVYSIDGKALLQKTENNRSTLSSLDISFLPNGLYILQLRNEDHFVKEKIVIAK